MIVDFCVTMALVVAAAFVTYTCYECFRAIETMMED